MTTLKQKLPCGNKERPGRLLRDRGGSEAVSKSVELHTHPGSQTR